MADKKDENKNENPLEAKVETLEELVVGYQEENEELKEKVAKLEETVNTVEAKATPRNKKLPVPEKQFQVDGTKYQFRVAQFRKDGKIIKAVDALEDRDLIKTIVTEHGPLVKKVEK